MTQHFLNGAQIGAIFKEMGRKAVAQGMGGYGFVNARFLLIRFYELPEALAGHALTIDIDEKCRFSRGGYHLRADKLRILTQGLYGGGIERDRTVMIAAMAGYYTGRQAEISDIKGNELAHTYAGGIKQLQHGTVAIALGINALGLLQKKLHLTAGEYLRELLRCLVRDKADGGIMIDKATAHQEGIKAFYGCNGTGYGCDRFATALQPVSIFTENGTVRTDKVAIRVGVQIFAKLAYIPEI